MIYYLVFIKCMPKSQPKNDIFLSYTSISVTYKTFWRLKREGKWNERTNMGFLSGWSGSISCILEQGKQEAPDKFHHSCLSLYWCIVYITGNGVGDVWHIRGWISQGNNFGVYVYILTSVIEYFQIHSYNSFMTFCSKVTNYFFNTYNWDAQ